MHYATFASLLYALRLFFTTMKKKSVCMELPRLRISKTPRGVGRMSMDADTYRAARQLRGSQSEVADFLRVSKATIHRREAGKIAITHEATLALLAMPPKLPANGAPAPTTAEMFPAEGAR
jgi:hypothetical protein